MADNEIIKALECCGSYCCNECAYFNDDLCIENMSKQAIDLINRQKAELSKKDTEIDILIRKKEALSDEISELKAEVERLQEEFDGETVENMRLGHEVERLEGILDKRCDVCPAVISALKEFWDRLRAKQFIHKNFGGLIYVDDGDNLVKEMTEEGAE